MKLALIRILILPAFALLNLQIYAFVPADSSFKAMQDIAGFKKNISAYSKSLSSIESNFMQKKSMSMLKTPVISEGYFCYKNGNQVRWEYTTPFSYIVIINDGKLTVKDESRTNNYDMTANKAFLDINTKLTSIIDGSILEDMQNFTPEFFESDLLFRIDLTPISVDMKAYFKTISVCFDKKDFSVARMQMIELSGDYTQIDFYQKQINQPISDEKFILR